MEYSNNITGLFPLRLFLLQGERTTLHISEVKYLQLMGDCLRENTMFGIPYQSKVKLHEYGTVVRIVEVSKKYKNGSIDVEVEAVKNFRLLNFEAQKEGKMYPGGQIKILGDIEVKLNEELLNLANDYNRLLFNKELDNYLSYSSFLRFVSSLGLEDEDKLKLIKFNPVRRMQFLVHKLKYVSILVRKEKSVEHQYHLN